MINASILFENDVLNDSKKKDSIYNKLWSFLLRNNIFAYSWYSLFIKIL